MLVGAKEAALILGTSRPMVYRMARRGDLARHAPLHARRMYEHAEVEALSLARLTTYHHQPHPHWATIAEAAAELGVSTRAVRQMMHTDRLPYETAANGRRYVRRHQLNVIANVRQTRSMERLVITGVARERHIAGRAQGQSRTVIGAAGEALGRTWVGPRD